VTEITRCVSRGCLFVHADPFDRIAFAQAMTQSWTIIAADPVLTHYAVPILPA
jgi:PIN domain nuclease of toxin-antitoxin system